MKQPGAGWDTDARFTSPDFKPATVSHAYGEGPWGNVFAAHGATKGGKRGGDSGPAYAGPPVPSMTVAKDFKAELLYSVPKETQGSWVGMTFDPKGRVIVSDQSGILYRITLDTPEKGKVQVQPLEITFTSPDGKKSEHLGGAHGLCWAFDSLYVMVSDGKVPKGLYRCFSSDGGETFNKVVQVREIKGGGEHGPHAVIPTPDGKGLYIIAGNHTDLTAFNSTLLPTNWQEDHLLPRMPDANGHAATRMAPGGWIMRIDPDGKEWQVYSVGYRNQFSAASNQLGDLITYDSDMEWDIGLPWYRPTRILFAPPRK
jgi:glucose/arabinose dehydrogenase